MSALPTILLADDDQNDILLIRRALAKASITNPLAVVEDGEAAIDYLDGRGAYADRLSHPLPGLLLLDLKMPRKTGFEVLQWLGGQPGLARLPVVVLTSSRETSDVNRAYDLGANSFLAKPSYPDDLLRVVRTLGLYWLEHNEPPDLLA